MPQQVAEVMRRRNSSRRSGGAGDLDAAAGVLQAQGLVLALAVDCEVDDLLSSDRPER